MEAFIIVCQIVIAMGIFNVWVIRFQASTAWRGGVATNMKHEFEIYGLPEWFMRIVGFLKVVFAASLVAGIWVPVIAKPAAFGMAILMTGAIAMHIKIADPIIKSLPALIMLVLSLIVIVM